MDLNLLLALDALLETESVTLAAKKLRLSAPATSRALSRLRAALGDPLLVRAGRGLVPTPRALSLRPRVQALVAEARTTLRPDAGPALERLERTFTLRTSDVVAGTIAARLAALVHRTAPRVTLRFAPEGEQDTNALREGRIDLDLGVVGESGPEIKVQALFRDHFVGVVRVGHALLQGRVTPRRYATELHVVASRRGQARGPVDDALATLDLSRRISLVVPGFYAALVVAANSDLVAAAPSRAISAARGLLGVEAFPLPVKAPRFQLAQAWHPRHDTDVAHRWLRGCVREACAEA